MKALLAHIHGDPALARMKPPLAPFSAADRAGAVAGYDQVRASASRDGVQNIRIAVIGGGIGGLTTAISLLQAGFDVQVYEQSRLLSEVGAGINIGPNASRILRRLGLGDECAKVAYRSPFFHQRPGTTAAR